ncbi:hypothetical protein EYF80_036376 [Liparis tanakae]|uniref:Uncharacterized protein n=1 Tax=Liparis tanakae TaxID=230148 RepID=A0A4Z2GJD0_9TELE|nr:hypothetical protein EYF80_036376 [Liparis tanakae]
MSLTFSSLLEPPSRVSLCLRTATVMASNMSALIRGSCFSGTPAAELEVVGDSSSILSSSSAFGSSSFSSGAKEVSAVNGLSGFSASFFGGPTGMGSKVPDRKGGDWTLKGFSASRTRLASGRKPTKGAMDATTSITTAMMSTDVSEVSTHSSRSPRDAGSGMPCGRETRGSNTKCTVSAVSFTATWHLV